MPVRCPTRWLCSSTTGAKNTTKSLQTPDGALHITEVHSTASAYDPLGLTVFPAPELYLRVTYHPDVMAAAVARSLLPRLLAILESMVSESR